MNVVHLIPSSKSLLTNETAKGVATICDHNKQPLGRDDMHRAREVYMDTFSGHHFMRVSHEEKEIYENEGVEPVYQGQGEVHGWFIAAPDFTIEGRLGDGPNEPASVHEHAAQV